uniref:Paternally expressed 3 n=1 Tax=Catagonus wagneri TaxID=51154 RepID=A0A8C3WC44_9CETA
MYEPEGEPEGLACSPDPSPGAGGRPVVECKWRPGLRLQGARGTSLPSCDSPAADSPTPVRGARAKGDTWVEGPLLGKEPARATHPWPGALLWDLRCASPGGGEGKGKAHSHPAVARGAPERHPPWCGVQVAGAGVGWRAAERAQAGAPKTSRPRPRPLDDSSSDSHSESSMSHRAAESPPPRSAHWERDRDWDQEHRRGRSRDLEPRDRWPYARTPRSRLPQRDLSLPLVERKAFAKGREHKRRDSVVGHEGRSQDAVSYQDVADLTEDQKLQNPIQDNMENYRKLLSLGVQLAEDDGHSHMAQGHSSRLRRSACPSTSRGLQTTPETKKSAHRRGICEEESSHGVIMEKFIKDVSRSSRSGRARGPGARPQRFPRRPDGGWKEASVSKREPATQERAYEGGAFGGRGFHCNSSLVSKKRVLERKRRYHFDTDGKGPVQDQRGCARKRPFECSEVRKAASVGSLGAPALPGSPPLDLGAMPYVCDECGRSFGVISEFVEHQIMHTRESLYEYGESFIHSVAVSEVQKSQEGGKRFECKECGETFNRSAALAEHRKTHAREPLVGGQGEEGEEPFMPSPTFSELQKIYGKDKFYECKVCKETFLHSSALIDHQRVHGRDDRASERGSPSLSELQRMYGRERLYECRVCGETFHHSAALREHQKLHTRGNPLENKGRVCEETFVPGQSLKRRQKTYSKERLCDFAAIGGPFGQGSHLVEQQKIRSRKNLFEGRGYEKAGVHGVPFPESQKSHTITRPPENEEDERAFPVSSKPAGSREATSAERSATPSSAFAAAQRSHSAAGPSRARVLAESAVQSSGVMEPRRVHAGGSSLERRMLESSVIHSLAALKPPRGRGASELLGGGKKGEPSTHLSGHRDQQGVPAREGPDEGGLENISKGLVAHGASQAQQQESLSGEGPSSVQKDGEPSDPKASAREHQKARAKKKNIERRDHGTPVIHSLRFGRPHTFRPREKLCDCPECGESFVRSFDLTEHQKIHGRKKPSGSKNYLRSVIRSLASADPQTSYAGQPAARSECKECGECFATGEELGAHRKIYAREEPHVGKLFGGPVIESAGGDGPRPEEPDEPDEQDDGEDSIYGCKDCGLGFADRADLRDHQKVHGREYLPDSREYTPSVVHTHSVSEYQRDDTGEQLYECPACGESFVHSSFLFEHQKVHEQDQFYGQRRYEEPFLQPLVLSPRGPGAPRKSPTGTSLLCQVCGRDFIHCSVLSEDMRVHAADDLPEQGPRGGGAGAGGPGVAPEAPQRDRDAEKRYECATCGESFRSQADLREHMRIHEKDEPYDYGASFVHTSFLTEPPRRDSPFYECKDCGKSFIHSTVLTKHQKLHLEEEEAAAAAAQEVEANVLVPREVLRIQGSNVEAAEPEVEAAEPEVEAAEPNVEAAEPNGEAEGPEGEAAEPSGEAEQPDAEAEQPDGDADEPDGAGIEDPEERAEEPEGDAEEPDGVGVEDPEEEGEDHEIQAEEPYYDRGERAEPFTSSSACGEDPKSHARSVTLEAGSVCGENSHHAEHAGTSGSGRADDKYFTCDVCGQVFSDRLSLARHRNSHTG